MSGRRGDRIGGIVLARLDSSRLPGKQLKEVLGRPIMDWLLERVARIEGLDEVTLATSDRPVDDPLEEFARDRSLPCFRGSAKDVAGRVLKCAHERGYDAWIRLNGDSPLLDYRLFTRGIAMFRKGGWDVVTNVLEKTYPAGNSVEIFDSEIFARGYTKMSQDRHFEHVTLYFYEHADDYRIHNFEREEGSLRTVSLTLDTPEDLERYAWMLERVNGDHLRLVGSAAIALALEYAKGGEEKGRR